MASISQTGGFRSSPRLLKIPTEFYYKVTLNPKRSRETNHKLFYIILRIIFLPKLAENISPLQNKQVTSVDFEDYIDPTASGWLKVRRYAKVPEHERIASTTFHIWLSSGDWLFGVVKCGGRQIFEFS
jgi:hypothetical protein